MAEFPGDEAPLPSLEDFLIDGVDDLEVSIGQLSIEGKCDYSAPYCANNIFASAHGLLNSLIFFFF